MAEAIRLKALGALVLCALLWSTSGVAIKLVTWNPVAIAGVRSGIAGLVLLAYLRRPRFDRPGLQIACAASYAATMISFVAANKLTTAANAIFLQYTSPVYAAVLGWLLLRERVGIRDWVTLAVMLGGMALLFMENLSFVGLWGNLLAVFSGMCFAMTFVLLRMQRHASPLESLMLGHFVAFLVSIAFLRPPWPSLAGWGGLAYLGVVQIGITSVLISYGLKHVPAFQSMVISLIEPVFNPVWVFLLVGEAPGATALAGGAVILGAVAARSVPWRPYRRALPRGADGEERSQ